MLKKYSFVSSIIERMKFRMKKVRNLKKRIKKLEKQIRKSQEQTLFDPLSYGFPFPSVTCM